MGYQALYRKYRPQTFEDVVGQQSVTLTLKTQLSTERLSHAYLFTGTRGTGKTTCAKILAKAVNCTDLQNGNPCNVCAACQSIDNGSCMDVLEIDAASNNGVDNVRDLRDEAKYTPSEVKRRVYIIDEVHMLSMAAFNALLKIIEEPPAHLVFILATTELHKVPATILSRCQRFSFRRLLVEDIASRMNYVAYSEGIEVEQEALNLLARLADGALRDGLSLLDQCASATAGTLTADGVYTALGLAGDRKTAQLMSAIAEENTALALDIFSKLYAEGKDVAAVVDELCALARDLLLMQTAPKQAMSMVSGVCTQEELTALLPKLSQGALLRMTKILQTTASGFKQSNNARLDTELCLMELSSVTMQLDAQSLNARLSKLERAVASGKFVAQAVAVTQPEPEEERPPLEEPPPLAEALQPSPQAAPTVDAPAMPSGFVADFKAAVMGELPKMLQPFFQKAQVSLQGQAVHVAVATVFDRNMFDDEAYYSVMREVAMGLLGRPAMVKVVVAGQSLDGEDPFEKLMDFSKQHGEIFDIQ